MTTTPEIGEDETQAASTVRVLSLIESYEAEDSICEPISGDATALRKGK